MPSTQRPGLPAFLPSLSVAAMSERLSQLLRQRALLQEHLAWLDREIAAVTEKPATSRAAREGQRNDDVLSPPIPPSPPTPPSPFPGSNLPLGSPIVATTVTELVRGSEEAGNADAILDQYRVPSNNLQQDIRKGCFLYLAAAFVVTGIVVAILWFALGRR